MMGVMSSSPVLGLGDHSDTQDAVSDPARLDALRATGLLDSDEEEAFDRLTRLAARLLQCEVAVMSLVDADRQFFKSHQGVGEPWKSRRETPLSHSFCQYVVRSGKPLLIDDARADPLVADNPAVTELDAVAYAGVPIHDGERRHVLGSFCVIAPEARTWSPDDLTILSDIAELVMTEVQLRRALTTIETRAVELDYLAHHDALTGLFNRRRFLEALDRTVAHARRYGRPGALLCVDLDNFKAVNDTAGHGAGDEILVAVASALTASLRSTDVIARMGGDEFAVLLLESSPEQAEHVARTVVEAVRHAGRVPDGALGPGVTASIGIAWWEASDGLDADRVLAEADAAMYDAKRAGGDRPARHRA
jgi:diguanylate cyclase (GGDEF)-like protein